MNSIYETVCLRLRKSNCETMYSVSLIFPPRDNRGQNNEQSECLLCSQLFIPSPGFKHTNKKNETWSQRERTEQTWIGCQGIKCNQ